ncbi:hypothetical protein BJV82DRAFT_614230 [Fennellomyces sp. T-0311]|nr:hypothetical protein BJV82DRAFT_614230 [Fennellomyces sp. T-0311]
MTTRDPCRRSLRRFSLTYIPQPVYLGVDVQVSPDKSVSDYAISVHDGSYTTDYFSGRLCKHQPNTPRGQCIREALDKLGYVIHAFSLAQHYKVQLVACSYWVLDDVVTDAERPEHTSMSRFWHDLDALPFLVKTNGSCSDERASAAVRKSVVWLSPGLPGNLPRTCLGFRHEVEVDMNYRIHMNDLADYRDTVKSETWRVLEEMVAGYKQRKLKVSFFSSTPQGGGVALMRHALLRFLHLNGITVHWYVMRPKPEIFQITKQKFHNMLQGVALPGVELEEAEKMAFTEWSTENVERFWLDDKGPIKTSDVVVMDDPQTSGLIPYVRKYGKKDVRVIFRSHIEIRADLIREHPDGRQAKTWDFLWGFIKEADLFISHPIPNFVPDGVPPQSVVLMPACTDPLDGLNKQLNSWCIRYYQRVFNRMCCDQGANEVDWERPYFVQVARFDPSKGIPDCLDAYRDLRIRLEKESYDPALLPQLVICGHGSIDDPEGTVIYEETHERLHHMKYADDIIISRLAPSDQLLNMILRGARAALQLSHREGFEIKVTEALQKGVPVIAYDAGGIPLQIKDNVDGYLRPIGDVHGVAECMYRLLTDDTTHGRMSETAINSLTEEYFTVWNAMNWLHLFIELTDHRPLGNKAKVSDLWAEKYHYQP